LLNRLLPRQFDNSYGGKVLALWLLGVVTVVRILQSVLVMANGRYVVQSADGIPLDAYPPTAAQTVVALFALLALQRLIVSLLCLLALARYRSVVPLTCTMLVMEQLARQVLLQFVPLARTGAPPGPVVNVVLLGLTVVALGLSLAGATAAPAEECTKDGGVC
jgi:hypothetical protein